MRILRHLSAKYRQALSVDMLIESEYRPICQPTFGQHVYRHWLPLVQYACQAILDQQSADTIPTLSQD